MSYVAKQIKELLETHTFNFSREGELQAGIAEVLSSCKLLCHRREERLSMGDRIDFVVWTPGGDANKVGLEVKIKGNPGDVFEQLARYAKHHCLAALVLVTSRRQAATYLDMWPDTWIPLYVVKI